MPSNLTTLLDWLSGEFDNRPQALDSPIWYVHLRLWHRPLPMLVGGNLAFFAEQANALYLDQPYRQRIAILQETGEAEIFRVQYRAFREPTRFKGAGAQPERLQQLVPDQDLEDLPGCELIVRKQDGFAAERGGDRFIATPPADACCYFQYNGETRQVVLGFEVSENQFWSYDKGVDPNTGQALWGALMGPYEYQKIGQ